MRRRLPVQPARRRRPLSLRFLPRAGRGRTRNGPAKLAQAQAPVAGRRCADDRPPSTAGRGAGFGRANALTGRAGGWPSRTPARTERWLACRQVRRGPAAHAAAAGAGAAAVRSHGRGCRRPHLRPPCELWSTAGCTCARRSRGSSSVPQHHCTPRTACRLPQVCATRCHKCETTALAAASGAEAQWLQRCKLERLRGCHRRLCSCETGPSATLSLAHQQRSRAHLAPAARRPRLLSSPRSCTTGLP